MDARCISRREKWQYTTPSALAACVTSGWESQGSCGPAGCVRSFVGTRSGKRSRGSWRRCAPAEAGNKNGHPHPSEVAVLSLERRQTLNPTDSRCSRRSSVTLLPNPKPAAACSLPLHAIGRGSPLGSPHPRRARGARSARSRYERSPSRRSSPVRPKRRRLLDRTSPIRSERRRPPGKMRVIQDHSTSTLTCTLVQPQVNPKEVTVKGHFAGTLMFTPPHPSGNTH